MTLYMGHLIVYSIVLFNGFIFTLKKFSEEVGVGFEPRIFDLRGNPSNHYTSEGSHIIYSILILHRPSKGP